MCPNRKTENPGAARFTRCDVSAIPKRCCSARRFLKCYNLCWKKWVLIPAMACLNSKINELARGSESRQSQKKCLLISCLFLQAAIRSCGLLWMGLLISNFRINYIPHMHIELLDFQQISYILTLTTNISHYMCLTRVSHILGNCSMDSLYLLVLSHFLFHCKNCYSILCIVI